MSLKCPWQIGTKRNEAKCSVQKVCASGWDPSSVGDAEVCGIAARPFFAHATPLRSTFAIRQIRQNNEKIDELQMPTPHANCNHKCEKVDVLCARKSRGCLSQAQGFVEVNVVVLDRDKDAFSGAAFSQQDDVRGLRCSLCGKGAILRFSYLDLRTSCRAAGARLPMPRLHFFRGSCSVPDTWASEWLTPGLLERRRHVTCQHVSHSWKTSRTRASFW